MVKQSNAIAENIGLTDFSRSIIHRHNENIQTQNYWVCTDLDPKDLPEHLRSKTAKGD